MTETLQRARFLSSYGWTDQSADFGGLSGLTLTADGRNFTALSDRAFLLRGTIHRHETRIIGLRSAGPEALNMPEDLIEDPVWDTEGLAQDGAGRLAISLETSNRILRQTDNGGWTLLPDHPQIAALPPNKGLEALAAGDADTLYAIPEVSGDLTTPFPVFRHLDATGWDIPFRIARSEGFLPVGADIGPDGRLYLLERGFSGFGFSSRVRRFDPHGAQLQYGEMLLHTKTRRHDNLEGIAVWRDEAGRMRLTMISDDNFNIFQRTEIVEYALE
ncbi:esterase-like activity of phytase family protein [Marivita sp. GX14005]|uniref:esterase-like activity of phytase family protein n=1 Tax=Marivita sp. GX14005 TaxID=2942276 RepID=UPI0020194FDD|nr:esterase-like activity of phytase family protein [Marivita sp. GX14005]MCL3881664.1 esterase-like activity of phytase family protein [Marivita sp. GX14005]